MSILAHPLERDASRPLLPAVSPARECSLAGGRLVLLPFAARFAGEVAGHLRDPRIAETYFALPAAERREAGIETRFMRRAAAGASAFVACRESDGALVGGISVANRRLAYFIAPEHWAQGYGGEMVETYCRRVWPESSAAPLEAHVLRENVASRRILERVGFRFGGLYPRALPAAPFRLSMLFYTL